MKTSPQIYQTEQVPREFCDENKGHAWRHEPYESTQSVQVVYWGLGEEYTQGRSVSQATEGSDLELRHGVSPLHMVQAAILAPARGALDLNGCSTFTSLKSIILEQKNFYSFWYWTPPVK